jgi:hypothetical protein
MRRQSNWQVRRMMMARDDGQRRWDTAYQLLLHWARDQDTARQTPSAAQQQENHHGAGRSVCAGIDHPPAADADH